MKRRIKNGFLLGLSCALAGVVALGTSVALPKANAAVVDAAKKDDIVSFIADTDISNVVWNVDNGSVIESTSYGGKDAKSIVLAGGETQQSVGANKETTTITTVQEYAEFDLYFDIVSYEYNKSATWTTNGAGFRIEFGNGMQLNLPKSGSNEYSKDAGTGFPFGNTETKSGYVSERTYWAHSTWSNEETKQFKLSVRDEGIVLYDLYLPAGNAGFAMAGGNYHSRWYGSHVTDGTQGYGYVKQSGDDYSADYGNISLSVLGFTTQQLALSRLEVVPFEETRSNDDFLATPDGKKDYKTEQTLDSALFTVTGGAVDDRPNKAGAVLAYNGNNVYNTSVDCATIESVYEYKNFELIVGIDRNITMDFKIDFGDGVSFTCYGTNDKPNTYLSYKGESIVSRNSTTNNFRFRTAAFSGGMNYIKISVKDGVFTYYDYYNTTTQEFEVTAETLSNWISDGYCAARVNHSALFTSGKIKIYPQDGNGDFILHSVEVINLDKDTSAVKTASYELFQADSLDLQLPQNADEVCAVKYANAIFDETHFSLSENTLKLSAENINDIFVQSGVYTNFCVVYTKRNAYPYSVTLVAPETVKISYKTKDGQTTLKEEDVPFYSVLTPYMPTDDDFYAWYDENGKKVDFSKYYAIQKVTFYEGKKTDVYEVNFEYKNTLAENKSFTLEVLCATTVEEAIRQLDEESDFNSVYGTMGYELLSWNYDLTDVIDEDITLTATYIKLMNSQDLFLDFDDGEFFDSLDWYTLMLRMEHSGNDNATWTYRSTFDDSLLTQQGYKDFEFSFDLSDLKDVFYGEQLFYVDFCVEEERKASTVGSRGGTSCMFTLSGNDLAAWVITPSSTTRAVVVPNFGDYTQGERREITWNGTEKGEFTFTNLYENQPIRIYVRREGTQLKLGYSRDGGNPVWNSTVTLPDEYEEKIGLVSLSRSDPRRHASTITIDNLSLVNLNKRASELRVLMMEGEGVSRVEKTPNADGTYNYTVGVDGIPDVMVSLRGQELYGIKYAVGINGAFETFKSADIIEEEFALISDTIHLNLPFISQLILKNQQALQNGCLQIKFRLVTRSDYIDFVLNVQSSQFTVKFFDGSSEWKTHTNVSFGQELSLANPPTKVGYDFLGYKDKLTGEIVQGKNLIALYKTDYELVYQRKTFTVRFYNKDGALLKTCRNVEYGSAVTDAPVNENGEAYQWTATFDNVVSDLDIYEKGAAGCNGTVENGSLMCVGLLFLALGVALNPRKKED